MNAVLDSQPLQLNHLQKQNLSQNKKYSDARSSERGTSGIQGVFQGATGPPGEARVGEAS